MNKKLKEKLIKIAKEKYNDDDPSHDFNHILRVLSNIESINKEEKADLDILIPAALFHDVVNYPKNDPKTKFASDESAIIVKKVLESIKEYPRHKVAQVEYAVSVCSFNKGIIPNTLEAKILQDADGLEATGAISIMRTYASAGQMKINFYNQKDPFCKKRKPEALQYALDLFYQRLLKIKERCHTKKGKKIAERRTKFLLKFLKEFEQELKGE
ncbi:MAG: HD domain-containing protein [Patescibacteria group bacterium]|nr:HD domain-containing protein [Patescibacteria group bacterium]